MSHSFSSSDSRPWLRPELVASWREIILVILIIIGPFAWRSTASALAGSGHRFIDLIFNDNRLLTNLVVEGTLLSFFLWVLHRRGWHPSDFRIGIRWWPSLQGVLLLFTIEIAQIVTGAILLVLYYALQHSYTDFISFLLAVSPHVTPHSIQVGWTALVTSMVLNAFFEETTCTGYVFTQLAAKLGPLAALLLTVLLRLACHTYQDPISLVRIGVVFLIFGLWYWRTRNLWILILAHALLDLISGFFLKTFFS